MVLPFEPLSVTFDKLRYAVDMPQFRPDDRSSKDHSPDEAKGKIQETTIHLRIENQGDKMNYENGTTEGTYRAEKSSRYPGSPSLLSPVTEEDEEPVHSDETSADDHDDIMQWSEQEMDDDVEEEYHGHGAQEMEIIRNSITQSLMNARNNVNI